MVARIKAIDTLILFALLYLPQINMARKKRSKQATPPPPPAKKASNKAKSTAEPSKRPKARPVPQALSDDEPDEPEESQLLLESPLSTTPTAPIEYGVSISVKYDKEQALSTIKFHTDLDETIFFWIKDMEEKAIREYSDKKGRTKHRIGRYIATILHSKARPKPIMMFQSFTEWDELIKLVKLTPCLTIAMVLHIESAWTRYMPKSLETSPEKPPTKKARVEVKEEPMEIDLT
jgi:hypothetical protein